MEPGNRFHQCSPKSLSCPLVTPHLSYPSLSVHHSRNAPQTNLLTLAMLRSFQLLRDKNLSLLTLLERRELKPSILCHQVHELSITRRLPILSIRLTRVELELESARVSDLQLPDRPSILPYILQLLRSHLRPP